MSLKNAFFFLTTAFFIVSCSDNSTDPGNGPDSNASFRVSGDIESEMTGIAQFQSLDQSSVYTWWIDIHDSPGGQTFSLDFSIISNEPIDRPSPGSYQIGFSPNDPTIFTANYVDTTPGFDDAVEYTTLWGDVGGVLVIEESTDEYVRGTFEFTAAKLDFATDEVIGMISVENGEFTAVKAIR